MARYFFDLHVDRAVTRDDIGTECSHLGEVRKAAQHQLPNVARDKIPQDGSRRSIVVLVTNEAGDPVYSASINQAGLC
ncbi:DUF6894 family protein [Methylobacterium oxalidis]|uniref:DUF6894 domain-containing protein n=1 Tax=Methylobacterium oxalidis TaxID=944322 RepID=A0A512J8P6_9HYPH|nr:hypothetical protein [Methylobacterium oxalidis]GEP06331.1 hypothetical protein MOX02_43690 [Methylobacterium oxalidis]GJE29915.1 hypothetical protein LDDCCGHA_0078 [Methylobacterium oxalidis]GLS62476.1 hypothetical protein GCM10007888_08570 [Methylobacterium oxalidis]